MVTKVSSGDDSELPLAIRAALSSGKGGRPIPSPRMERSMAYTKHDSAPLPANMCRAVITVARLQVLRVIPVSVPARPVARPMEAGASVDREFPDRSQPPLGLSVRSA